jgi:hypothetical protein
MTSTATSGVVTASNRRPPAQLDLTDALDLLSDAVAQADAGGTRPCHSGQDRTRHAHPNARTDEERSILGRALSLAGVSDEDVEASCSRPLRDLYRERGFPIDITLGALIVLDAAQRSEARGQSRDDVLDDAVCAAAKFLDLIYEFPTSRNSSTLPGRRG